MKRERAIMGRNCVREAVRHCPERIKKIWVGSEELLEEMRQAGLPVEKASKERLNRLVQSESHQSVVALVSEKPPVDLKEFLKERADHPSSLLLFLDSIYDPQNLGAIMRSAECFGADALIWSSNRGVGMTPVVSKAAVGASELLTTIRVSNLVSAIQLCRKEGYRIAAAELASEAQSIYRYEFPQRCGLIFGSEGKGIRKLTGEQADDRLMIPMLGKIGSLNVAQAAAVFLSHHAAYRERRRS